MKKLLLLLFISVFYFNAYSQTSGGPDAYGYVWRDSNDPNGPVYNWIDVPTLTDAQEVTLLADDNTRGPFALSAPFHFYWYDVSTFWVGSNGYIAFGNAALASPFLSIPSVTAPHNFIAGMLSDLNFDGAGNIAECWYWRNAMADTLIVSWINVPFWDPASQFVGANTFQIILSAVDSSITMQYALQSGLTNVGPGDYMSIGIENNSGAIGLEHSHNVYPVANYAVKYYYPQNTTFQVNDASCSYVDNETTGGIFVSKSATDTFKLSSEIKNTGNTVLNPFNVQSTVKSPTNLTVASNALTSDTLQAGQTQVLNFAQGFIPTATGTYQSTTSTLLGGDATPSNNSLTQEIVVIDSNAANQWLGYDNGVANATGISWQGGNGGVGNYFKPPYYPCNIEAVRCFITADPSLVGYSAMIFDDDGLNGTPGTLLDSQFVSATSIGAWNTTNTTAPITINSGGVFVAWYMGGPDVALGLNTAPPISNRSYELLGNAWAIYRNRAVEDVMLNIKIAKLTFQGIVENSNLSLQLYPNPASDVAFIKVEAKENIKQLSYEILTMHGQKVSSGVELPNDALVQVAIDTKNLPAALYVCRIKINDTVITRSLSVTH